MIFSRHKSHKCNNYSGEMEIPKICARCQLLDTGNVTKLILEQSQCLMQRYPKLKTSRRQENLVRDVHLMTEKLRKLQKLCY